MTRLRRLTRHHLGAVWLLLAAILGLRLLVPDGFMPGLTASGAAIVICDGTGDATHAMAGMAGHHDNRSKPAHPVPPCSFAGLNVAHLGGADPIQLAIALALAVAAALFEPSPLQLAHPGRLRPPLRGPPALA